MVFTPDPVLALSLPAVVWFGHGLAVAVGHACGAVRDIRAWLARRRVRRSRDRLFDGYGLPAGGLA
jgi:hypothetical protein